MTRQDGRCAAALERSASVAGAPACTCSARPIAADLEAIGRLQSLRDRSRRDQASADALPFDLKTRLTELRAPAARRVGCHAVPRRSWHSAARDWRVRRFDVVPQGDTAARFPVARNASGTLATARGRQSRRASCDRWLCRCRPMRRASSCFATWRRARRSSEGLVPGGMVDMRATVAASRATSIRTLATVAVVLAVPSAACDAPDVPGALARRCRVRAVILQVPAAKGASPRGRGRRGARR